MSKNTQLSAVTSQVLLKPEAQPIHGELKNRGYGVTISKVEYAEIIDCSLSAVDNYIKCGYGIPNYVKLGKKKNSRVRFLLVEVANYLAKQTIHTV